MRKRLAPAAVAAISNGITIGDANPPVPTSATIVKKLDPPMSEIASNISTMDGYLIILPCFSNVFDIEKHTI